MTPIFIVWKEWSNALVLTVSITSRHPGVKSAMSNFANINQAFVGIIKQFECTAQEGPITSSTLARCQEYVPGEVDTRENIIRCKIQDNKIWKNAVKERSEQRRIDVMYQCFCRVTSRSSVSVE